MIFVPLAVPAPYASTHSPDCTPVIVPFEFMFHCWFAWPLQSQMITWVPLDVPRPYASRHLLPLYTVNCLLAVYVQRWPVALPQSNNWTWVPLVVVELGMSRQRPDWPPTIVESWGAATAADAIRTMTIPMTVARTTAAAAAASLSGRPDGLT